MKKLFLNPILLSLIFIVTCTTTHAQSIRNDGKVSGKVSNQDLEPAIYATIGLLNSKDSLLVKGSLTDESGGFKLENIPNGNYLLEIQYFGYKKLYTDSFAISEDKKIINFNELLLEESMEELDAVTITAKTPFIEKRIDKTILNVQQSVLSAGNTALEILQRAPGVNVDNRGNISLQGKQGVLIMINDKPTYLSTDQLLNLLRTTDGNSIGTVELITNPSSKYDAAGNSGIINIKLKKNRDYGTNGSVSLGAGYGEDYKANTSISLNHREEKFNIYGSYNFSDSKSLTDLNLSRDSKLEDEITYFNQTGSARSHYTNNSYRAGVDFFLNETNTLGFMVDGQFNRRDIKSSSETYIGSRPGIVDSIVVANNPTLGKNRNITYNLNYQTVLDTLGQELNVDLDYAKYRNRGDNNYNNNIFDASGEEQIGRRIFRSITPTTINIWSGKIDYNYTFDESLKLESGFKSSLVETDNNFQFDNLIEGEWVDNTERSNQFVYRENINAAYVSLNKEYGAFTLQAGLRAEQTISEGNSITEQNIVKRDYLDLFPSLFAEFELSEKSDLGFSYGRRIDRPDYASLNPFVEFVDLYTFEQGNPFLNPQYTNSFELSWSLMDTYLFSLSYSKTDDVISTAILSDPVDKTLFITQLNLAEQTSYNLNINAPVAITDFWNTDNSFTLFRNDFSSPNIMGSPYNSGQLSFLFNSYHSIKINSTINAELSGYYLSSQVNGTYGIEPLTAIDFGVNKSFADGKGNIKFSVNDIFNTNITRVTSEIPLQNYNLKQKEETRVFRLGISYDLGSLEIKGPRSRNTGSSEEENRIQEN